MKPPPGKACYHRAPTGWLSGRRHSPWLTASAPLPHQHPTPDASHLQVGRLWTSLADYYIRRGMFEKARDVYEEGLTSVITVHDFSLIFDAYTQVGLWEVRGGQ